MESHPSSTGLAAPAEDEARRALPQNCTAAGGASSSWRTAATHAQPRSKQPSGAHRPTTATEPKTATACTDTTTRTSRSGSQPHRMESSAGCRKQSPTQPPSPPQPPEDPPEPTEPATATTTPSSTTTTAAATSSTTTTTTTTPTAATNAAARQESAATKESELYTWAAATTTTTTGFCPAAGHGERVLVRRGKRLRANFGLEEGGDGLPTSLAFESSMSKWVGEPDSGGED